MLERLLAAAQEDVGGGRHPGLLHQLLGEGLRPLQLGGGGAGAEGGDAGLLQRVDGPGDQRRLGPDRDQVDGRAPAPPRRSPRRRRRPTSGRHSASAAIPALPGAQSSSGARGERASARTIACSRPPPPTTRTFKPAPPRARRQLVGRHRRQRLAGHRPARAELDRDLGHRLLVGRLDDRDEVVLAQRRVLRQHLRPDLFDLFVDLGDPAGLFFSVRTPSAVRLVSIT